MLRLLYTLILIVIFPLVLAKMGLRKLRDKEGHRTAGPRRRLFERFGIIRANHAQRGVVFHTVSVGETIAAIDLILRFIDRYPGLPVTVTCTTQTGSKIIQTRLTGRVFHCYLPFDLPWFIDGFLQRLEPRAIVILETELWPNLLYQCDRKGIPSILINARLSAKSYHGYRKFLPLVTPMINTLSYVCCQSDEDAKNFRKLGLDNNRCAVMGNLKFDIRKDPQLDSLSKSLDEKLFSCRQKWIAASTHPGEDEILLRAHRELVKRFPSLILILVPRHPQRANELAMLCKTHSFECKRRSDQIPTDAADQVFILDTIGELMQFFALSDVCFIGGSLVERGGHNPLEPALLSKPILSGPHVHNFAKIYHDLQQASAVVMVNTSESIVRSTESILQNPQQSAHLGANAFSYLSQHQGATEKTLAVLAQFFECKSTDQNVK